MGDLRYWDGRAWTPGVVIRGVVSEQPMPWPPVARTPSGEADDRARLPGRAALYALVGFVVGIVSGIGLGIAADLLGLPDIGILLLSEVGLWSGLLGACWKASRRYGTGDLRRDFGLRFRGADVGWGLLMSIGARIAAAIAIAPFVAAGKQFVGNNQGVYGKVTGNVGTFVVFAVIAVVGAPIVEELFFRGLLMRSLQGALGTPWAVAVQALLFGLAHASPLLGFANFSVTASIAAAGAVFGLTAWWRRVGTSVVSHAAFNLVSVIAVAFLTF